MSKVAIEVAAAEVEKWLDFKKVSSSKREKLKENIDALAEAISTGVLVLTEKNEWKQTLNFPLEGDSVITEMIYKPRLNVAQVSDKLKGVNSKDLKGFLAAYVSALTDQPMALCKKLDTEDNSLAENIAVFFL